jgi:hypothetical protein
VKKVKKCNVQPYSGVQDYIFVCYSHRDMAKVFPVIENFVKDGYRVFFYNEFDCFYEAVDIIAKISRCAGMIFFATDNSLSSIDCFNELNFALSRGKNILSVFVEPVFLTPGRELLLSDIQSLYKYNYENESEFFSNIYDIEIFKSCLGTPCPTVIVSKTEDYVVNLKCLYGIDELRRFSFKNRKSFYQLNNNVAFLKRYKTNEIVELLFPETILGRDENVSDYVVDNCTVSRLHAKVFKNNGEYYLQDCRSTNKTFLNSDELIPSNLYKLVDGDVIIFSNERFDFCRMEGQYA